MQNLNKAAKLVSENDLKSVYTAPSPLPDIDQAYWGGVLMGRVITTKTGRFRATSLDAEDMIPGDDYETFEIAAQVACGVATDVNVVRMNHQ